MSDGLTEWTGLCFLNIKVDPLMIACRIGKKLNLFLSDCHVVAETQVLADMSFEIFVVFNDCCHAQSLAIPDALVLTGLGVEEKSYERNVKSTADDRTSENPSRKIVGELDRGVEHKV